MKHALIVAVLLLGLPSVVAGPARPGTPPKAGGKVTVENVVSLPKDLRMPARLSPDGKQVLCTKREKDRKLAYYLVSLDGKTQTKLYQTAITWDDLLGMAFGQGMWSPDGKRVAVMTADDDRGRNPRMAVYDLEAKQATLLPCDRQSTLGAVFVSNDAVCYMDSTDLKDERRIAGSLRRYDVRTKKAETLAEYDPGMVACLTASPDRSRLGGLIIRPKGPDKREPAFRVWAFELATKKTVQSQAIHTDDYAGDTIVIFWGADGKALYLNGDLDPDARAKRGKREFSILRFEPFAEAGARLTALQEGRSMLTMGAFGPGKLSVTDRKERRKGAKGGVLDVKTDTVRELNPALLLLDRRGDAGLFIRLLTEDLATAKLGWQ